MTDSIDGAFLLDEVRAFIRRFCVFPDEHCLTAVTLWAAHAHMAEHFYTTPRLAVLSPEPESGKTRVLEVLSILVPDAMFCLSPSPATVFRKLASQRVTLLIDECDTIFRTRGKDDTNEDLRALLNAGYKRTATIPRCVGPNHEVVDFPVFCATALDGIGDLPDTIMTRSVIIRMRRRPHEYVEPFRSRVDEPKGHALRDRIAAWAEIVGKDVGDAWPDLPAGIRDRPAEIWETRRSRLPTPRAVHGLNSRAKHARACAVSRSIAASVLASDCWRTCKSSSATPMRCIPKPSCTD